MYTKVAKKPLYYSPGKGFQNEDIWKFEFWNALVSVFTHLRGKQNQIFTFQLQIWIWLVFFDVEYTIQMHRLEAKAYLLFLCRLVCFVACSRANFEIYVSRLRMYFCGLLFVSLSKNGKVPQRNVAI